MYFGIPNPNAMIPVKKMKIKNLDTGETINVLYNPQSYTQTRSVRYGQISLLNSDAPLVQFQNGSGEMLSFDLFFDTLSAGAEVGGSIGDKLKFAATSLLPSAAAPDVRDYTKKVYNLTRIEVSVHRPPELKLEWASLQFQGFMVSCRERFTKFNEAGKPVRAILSCQFIEHMDIKKLFGTKPLESPDTTKYRRVEQGDSLWAYAAKEYGESGQWRHIATANGLANPRMLHAGDMISLPALKE